MIAAPCMCVCVGVGVAPHLQLNGPENECNRLCATAGDTGRLRCRRRSGDSPRMISGGSGTGWRFQFTECSRLSFMGWRNCYN